MYKKCLFPKNVTKKHFCFTHLDRSQSVGPAPTNVDGSPKRQVRSGSAAPASTKSTKKTPVSTPTVVERRPRPSEFILNANTN